MKFLIFILLFISAPLCATQSSLYGMVIIIDPGHGGSDPGASGFFKKNGHGKKIRISEDEYVYDVSMRLARMIRKHGGIVKYTVYDSQQKISSRKPSFVLPSDKRERFSFDQSQAHSGKNNFLEKRTRYANSFLLQYKKHRIVFLSIHFDSQGNKNLSGAHFVRPRTHTPEIVPYLERSFRDRNRLRTLNGKEYHPVTRNGDVRSLFVLRSEENFIRQRVLIELGNFSNADDVWRLRDYRVRENYAQGILDALQKTNRLPLSRFR